jgi:hypothetical protein
MLNVIMLNVTYKSFVLSVVRLNVAMLSGHGDKITSLGSDGTG